MNNYNGESLTKTIEISAVRPEVVIESRYPRDVFSSSRIQVRALPYFFTTNDPTRLEYVWTVNGQKPKSEENISFLDVNLGGGVAEGYLLDIKLSVSHPTNFALMGSASKLLTFQK